MKRELIELVFEDVPKERLNDFLAALFPMSDVLKMVSDDVVIEFNDDAVFDFFELASSRESAASSVFINTSSIRLDGLTIDGPLVEVLMYGGLIDVLVIFSMGDVRAKADEDPIKVMQYFSISIAEKNGSSNFYCGLEPAKDVETRFFSGKELGPLVSPWPARY